MISTKISDFILW